MLSLNDRNWNPYKIKDIFVTIKDESQVPTGAYIEKQYLDTGNTPRVTVTSTNNGIDNFWSTEHKNNREFSNFISVNFLGDAFYHPYTASLDPALLRNYTYEITDKALQTPVSWAFALSKAVLTFLYNRYILYLCGGDTYGSAQGSED